VTLRRAIRAFLFNTRGAVAIEFAAIALPLMLLLGGSIEVSRYVWTRLALQDAASTGARCVGLRLAPCFAAENMDASGTVGFVQAQAGAWAIEIPEGSVTPEAATACHGVADFAKIEIRHRFTDVLAILPETWIDVEACFPVMPSE
jgi:Flp pilus assembly protein TadG